MIVGLCLFQNMLLIYIIVRGGNGVHYCTRRYITVRVGFTDRDEVEVCNIGPNEYCNATDKCNKPPPRTVCCLIVQDAHYQVIITATKRKRGGGLGEGGSPPP